MFGWIGGDAVVDCKECKERKGKERKGEGKNG